MGPYGGPKGTNMEKLDTTKLPPVYKLIIEPYSSDATEKTMSIIIWSGQRTKIVNYTNQVLNEYGPNYNQWITKGTNDNE